MRARVISVGVKEIRKAEIVGMIYESALEAGGIETNLDFTEKACTLSPFAKNEPPQDHILQFAKIDWFAEVTITS